MSFNYSKLKGRIVEKYGTQAAFAKDMGLSERSLSLKMNNHVPFSQPEIKRAAVLLDAEDSDIPALFFTKEVQKIEQSVVNDSAVPVQED